MEIFVWATDHDMNMHAKIQSMNFIKKYFKVLLHVILYHVLLSKLE
jgi:hypothetical protein